MASHAPDDSLANALAVEVEKIRLDVAVLTGRALPDAVVNLDPLGRIHEVMDSQYTRCGWEWTEINSAVYYEGQFSERRRCGKCLGRRVRPSH